MAIIGHKNKVSLLQQMTAVYQSKLKIGESKHLHKIKGDETDWIFSWSTYRAYTKHARYFLVWAKSKYKCKTLAQATVVRVTLPKVTERPPIPAMRMTETTKRLRFFSRSTFWIIFRPETAMKPYRAMHTPPMTQEGMVLTKATKGDRKEIAMAKKAVTVMVMTEALPVMATQPTDSP